MSEVTASAVSAALDRLSDGLARLQLRLPPQSTESLDRGTQMVLPEPLGMRTLVLRDGMLFVSDGHDEIAARGSHHSKWLAVPLATEAVSLWEPMQETTQSRAGRLRPVAQLVDFGARQLYVGRMDRSSRLSVAHAAARLLVRGERRSQGAAGPSGGIVAHWHGEELVFDDDGGILDLNPNTERDVWLPQAMGMYYADAFAAYLFARRFARSGEKVWRARSVESFNHAARTYFDYPTSSIWYHHDFKNAALLETELLIAGEDLFVLPHEDLVLDAYEPANVFAVRAHWLALRGTAGDQRRLQQCIRVLSASVRPDGLLLDDRRGLSSDVRDLGYTGFATGFLARLLNVDPANSSASAIQLRSLELLSEMTTQSGEIAFFGRGANSTYHLAATAYALADGSTRFGREDFRTASLRLVDRLLRYQDEDGLFPSACNDDAAVRMGWNTCHTSYSALIGYFLEHLAEVLVSPVRDRTQLTKPDEKRAASSAIIRLSSEQCEAVVIAPGGSRARWSGLRTSGVPGIAYFGIRGEDSVIALPDHVDGELPITNLPSTGTVVDYSSASVDHTPAGASLVIPSELNGAATHSISLRDSRLQITTTTSAAAGLVEFDLRIGLVGRWSTSGEDDGVLRLRRTGRGLSIKGPFGRCSIEPLRSNPRGHGTLVALAGEVVGGVDLKFELLLDER